MKSHIAFIEIDYGKPNVRGPSVDLEGPGCETLKG